MFVENLSKQVFFNFMNKNPSFLIFCFSCTVFKRPDSLYTVLYASARFESATAVPVGKIIPAFEKEGCLTTVCE